MKSLLVKIYLLIGLLTSIGLAYANHQGVIFWNYFSAESMERSQGSRFNHK